MIRIFSMIAFILALVVLANAQQSEFPKSIHIKSLRRETAKLTYENGQAKESPRVTLEETTYDQKGGAAEQIVNNPDGTFKSKLGWESTYDSQGKEIARTYFGANRKPTSRSTTIYDDNGRVTQVSFFGSEGPAIYNMLVSYDEKGKVSKEDRRNPDGTCRGFLEYAYDSKGNRTEEIYHNGKGAIYQRNVYSFDERGRMITSSIYDGDGASLIQELFTYDDKDNMIDASRYQRDTLLLSKSFKYDAFDDHGNWTKRRIARKGTERGTPFSENVVEYRTMTYY